MTPQGRIWIQGAGEMASGVAWQLLNSGYRVVAAEMPGPKAVRRLVCFSEAVYAGTTTVQGATGRLVGAATVAFAAGEVTVTVDPEGSALARLVPDAIIDARMTKRPPVRPLLAGIPVIGLGPGFVCGRDADLIVETHREAALGAVIAQGAAMADTGIPGKLGGESGKRILRAPRSGRFCSPKFIGDLVREGETIGDVAGRPVVSLLDGMLRGLVHPRAELSAGEKVGDVDPRGRAIDPALISDKALAVGAGALRALALLGISGDPSR